MRIEDRLTLPRPPTAARRPLRTHVHGVELVDDYAWLRAENWQDVMRDPAVLDAEIRGYLEAENAYMGAAMADTATLQERLFQEMKGRIKEDDSSVPSPDGPWEYYTGYITGGQYPLICRRPRDGGSEQVLIDGNSEAAGLAYWSFGGASHSRDHRYLAYAVDDKGSELFTIRIRDLETGKDLPETIIETRGGMVWAADHRTLFYVRLDENHRPLMIYRHRLGTAAEADVKVYEEADHGFYVGLGETQSGRFIVIHAHDHQTSEAHVIDAATPDAMPRCLLRREVGHEYHVEHAVGPGGERFILTTNSGGAEDFRICEAPLRVPTNPADWREIVPHKPGCLILEATCLAGHLVRLEREDSLPRIVVHRLADGLEHQIAFDEEAYSLGLSTGYEFDTTTVRFTYSSMTTPAQVYDYDMESRRRTLRKTQEVPSGHTIADYVTRRVLAPTKDGETVPVSILYHRTTKLDGTAPLYLYGYGAYGISIPASFRTGWLSLADRGFICAIAHIRGGKDKGYRWYKAGKMEAKVNTFTDYIAAGEHIARLGWVRRGNIVGHGGSAGGMLMGAVANMAPDLFLGLIADVPFVDVLNTMLDKDLPLTPPEWPEWGNPIASKADFDRISSYSPYDNVRAQKYPHILAEGGLTDPRVTYWEPAKWVARLRAMKTDGNLLMLYTNMDAGHGGASGRFEQLKEIAKEYAFALKITGKMAV